MYFPRPAINENDLAIIERGDTASHSIEAGQYVSWKGKLGKANAAILQGATLDDSLFSYETDGVINSLNNNFPGFFGEELTYVSGPNLPFTYTATEDCWFHCSTDCTDGQGWTVRIGSSSAKVVWGSYGVNSVAGEWTGNIPLKAGQTVYVAAQNTKPKYSSYTVFRMIR